MKTASGVYCVSIGIALSLAGCAKGGGSGSVVPPGPPPVSSVTVASMSPQDGSVGVPVDVQIQVAFTEAIDPSSVTTATFLLTNGINQIAGSVVADAMSATFIPASPLNQFTPYKITLTTEVEDASGLPLSQEVSAGFKTADIALPFVVSTLPAPGQTFVPTSTPIQVFFSEPIVPETIDDASFQVTGPGGQEVPGSFVLSGNFVTMIFDNILQETQLYTVTVGPGVLDIAGNPMAAPFSWTFTTTESVQPEVLSHFPDDGAIKQELDVTPQVVFSEEMHPLSITGGGLLLQGPNGFVAGSVDYDALTSTATFTPTDLLPQNTLFTVSISGSISDLAGNLLANPQSFSFTTKIKALGNPEILDLLDISVTQPQVAADAGGAAMAVWIQKNSSPATIPASVQSRHFDPVLGWGNVLEVELDETNAMSAQFPSVVADNLGGFFSAWEQAVETNGTAGKQAADKFHVFGNHFDPSSGWGPRVQLNLATTGSNADALDSRLGADANGNAMVVWIQVHANVAAGGKKTIHYCRYDAGTGLWGLPQAGSPNLVDPGFVWIAQDGVIDLAVDPSTGNALVVWGQVDPAAPAGANFVRAFGSFYDALLGSWSTPEPLRDLNLLGNALTVKVSSDPNGRFLVAWAEGYDIDGDGNFGQVGGSGDFNDFVEPTVASLFARRYDPFATVPGWNPEGVELLEIEAPAVSSLEAKLDASGNGLVVWQQSIGIPSGGDGVASIYSRYFDVSTGQWVPALLAPPVPVEASSEPASQPRLAVHNTLPSSFLCVWIQKDEDFAQDSFFVNRRDPVTGEWFGEILIEEMNTGAANNPAIATDDSANATCLWTIPDDGTNINSLWSTRFLFPEE